MYVTKTEKKMTHLDIKELKGKIDALKSVRTLVIGDLAIDEMIYGTTARISREAPVLILKHTDTKIILGGGANAVHNAAALSTQKCAAIGVYGDDYHAPILLEALRKANIDTQYMVLDKNRPTTTKTRISGSSTQSVTQQIVRIDRELNEPVSKEVEDKVIEQIKKAVPEFDAVILSDYGIGMMTENIIRATIETARKHNVVVAVDAQSDLFRFKDATVLTPNQPDAEKAVGYFITNEKTLLSAGRDLLSQTNADMILITRGSYGMVLFMKNGEVHRVPAFNKTDVFDVTGAGDTVVATFTMGLASKAEPQEAMILGNLAASIVIRQFGCATTTCEELKQHIEEIEFSNEKEYIER